MDSDTVAIQLRTVVKRLLANVTRIPSAILVNVEHVAAHVVHSFERLVAVVAGKLREAPVHAPDVTPHIVFAVGLKFAVGALDRFLGMFAPRVNVEILLPLGGKGAGGALIRFLALFMHSFHVDFQVVRLHRFPAF